jgi:hypothetical protein
MLQHSAGWSATTAGGSVWLVRTVIVLAVALGFEPHDDGPAEALGVKGPARAYTVVEPRGPVRRMSTP